MVATLRYLAPDASRVLEEVVAEHEVSAATSQIEATGGQVLSIDRASGKPGPSPVKATKRSRTEAALICKELKALLSAGLSVVEALEALAMEGTGSAARGSEVFAQLLERLRAGRPLSGAMGDVGGFSPLLVASVQSSERTSNLVEALDAFLHYDELIGVLERRVVSAAVYPAIVVTLGAAIAIFLLWVVVPRFASLYGQMAAGASSATSVVLHVSVALKSHPYLVPAVAIALIGSLTALVRTGVAGRAARRTIDAVPALRRQAQHFERARLFEAMALLVKGGYSLHEALGMCAAIASTGAPRRRVLEAQALVERGGAISSALTAATLTDAVTERLLRAGERGGSFDGVLKAISQRHAMAFETFVERSTKVVEPVLLLGVALLVGGMVTLLYMPIFDIASAVR